MYKYLFIFFSLFAPVNIITLRGGSINNRLNNSIVAMLPSPGGFISYQTGLAVTNRVNPPGCSTDIRRNLIRNGDIEEQRTITCTTVTTIESGPGRVKKQRPRVSSSLHEGDLRCRMIFLKKENRMQKLEEEVADQAVQEKTEAQVVQKDKVSLNRSVL